MPGIHSWKLIRSYYAQRNRARSRRCGLSLVLICNLGTCNFGRLIYEYIYTDIKTCDSLAMYARYRAGQYMHFAE